ncbi:alkyl sulfatase dimerization domain-containing protein [Microbulbifer agarilyticus]
MPDESGHAQVEPVSPDAVNPLLYEHLRTENHEAGLYQLGEGIYQIRGDLADITLLRGDSGWIVIDAGATKEFTQSAWGIAQSHLPGGESVPISTVIYSHTHIDHFGGVKGLIDESDVRSGKVQVIAPYGFMQHVLAENVIAGTAMQRRAHYNFGLTLDTKPDGRERFYRPFAGGSYSLIEPTVELPPGQGEITEKVVDGIALRFKDIGGAEAPSATLVYWPERKMIYNSELMFRGQHNIYALRGAAVRDALAWSKLINEVILEWGDEVELMTGPHGPTFSGNGRILEFMKIQRDNYGFIHNQSVRLMNSGVKLQDVGDAVKAMVPKSLSSVWHTHGFHGSYSHNARGVVSRYLGFYDGNPATLNPLPSKQEANQYIRYMGGGDAVLKKAKVDFAEGNYRFVASVLNKLVISQPDNWPARHLLASALEQLAFQEKNPQWRNAYLAGAKELRTGKVQVPGVKINPNGLLKAASIENILDSMAVRLNAEKAGNSALSFNLVVEDTREIFLVELSNGNLSYGRTTQVNSSGTTLRVNRSDLIRLITGEMSFSEKLKFSYSAINGSPVPLINLIRFLDKDNVQHELVPMPEN